MDDKFTHFYEFLVTQSKYISFMFGCNCCLNIPLKSLELISLKLAISRDFYPTHKKMTPASPAQELLTNQRSILANGRILTQMFERLGAEPSIHNL